VSFEAASHSWFSIISLPVKGNARFQSRRVRFPISRKSNRCCLKSNFWEGESTADWLGESLPCVLVWTAEPPGEAGSDFRSFVTTESDDVSGGGLVGSCVGETTRVCGAGR